MFWVDTFYFSYFLDQLPPYLAMEVKLSIVSVGPKMDKFDHWNLIYFLLQQQQNAPTHSCLTELHVHRCLFSLIVKFFH